MGRGHIRKRGRDSWEVRYAAAADHGGKRKTRTLTVRGLRGEAEKRLTELLRERDNRVECRSEQDHARSVP